jgi:gliding motility-associated protein GldE
MTSTEPSSYLEITPAIASFESSSVVYLILIILLLIVSALMSGSESAYFSLKPADLEELKKENTNKSRLILKLLSSPKNLLATILIVNNFVNVGVILLSTIVIGEIFPFEHYSPLVKFLIEVVGITFFLLLLGEVAPKIFANNNQKKVVNLMAVPLNLLSKTPPFSWARWLLVNSSFFIQKMGKRHSAVNSDELEQALALTKDESTSDDDHKILEGIVKFGKTEASEIMTPRVEVEAIDKNMALDEVLHDIMEAGYSRMPVYENQPDNVVGILYIKDLLAHSESLSFDWFQVVRKPFFVPENKKINHLLQDFRKMKMHMAIVVDEYGGASGVVTLEDVLEEIVGDITDEFDENEVIFSKLDDNTYIFEGRTSINDFCKVLELNYNAFDDDRGEAETLGGLLTEKAGRILKNNEYVILNDFKFIVESSDKRRVKTIKLVRLNA